MSKDTQQQKQFRVLVVGDACLDLYCFGSCDRISPEAPVPIFKRESVESRQGMCLNVSSNLKSLGNSVSVDRNSEIIKKTRIIDKRSGQHILRIDEEPIIKRVDLRKYTVNSMKEYDALVISDYNKGYIAQGDIIDLIYPAKSLGIPVFVDSKKKDLRNFEDCIIKINEKERSLITSFPKKCETIVTMGSKGAVWRNKKYPTLRVPVHDVCGAGDVFLAGLVTMYLESQGNMAKSILFANRCAAASVSRFGTYTIKREDIK